MTTPNRAVQRPSTQPELITRQAVVEMIRQELESHESKLKDWTDARLCRTMARLFRELPKTISEAVKTELESATSPETIAAGVATKLRQNLTDVLEPYMTGEKQRADAIEGSLGTDRRSRR